MSYLVLARKWRPQRFEEVVGQQHVTRTLANAIRQDRVAHAFLFTGSRGVGKTSTARILAKAMNCVNGPTPEPCNECIACTEITNGRAVDVIEIDGASNRGINEIREVREAVRYAPSRDRYKVYIIDEVHMLTTEAFNALLKTLEEPPPHAIFVFATTEPNKIPVTILSRTQRYDFKRVQIRDIVKRLTTIADAEGLEYEDAALALIARHARGGVRDSLSAMDQVIAFTDGHITADKTAEILGVAGREYLLRLGHALVSRDVDEALSVLDYIDGYGHDLVHFAVEILHHLRDMTIVRSVTESREITDLSDGEYQLVAQHVEHTTIGQLQRLFQLMAEAVEQITRSQFPKLLLEMTLVKLAAVEPLVPLEPLLARLESLERSLGADDSIDDETWSRYRSLLEETAPPPREVNVVVERVASSAARQTQTAPTPSAEVTDEDEPAEPGGEAEATRTKALDDGPPPSSWDYPEAQDAQANDEPETGDTESASAEPSPSPRQAAEPSSSPSQPAEPSPSPSQAEGPREVQDAAPSSGDDPRSTSGQTEDAEPGVAEDPAPQSLAEAGEPKREDSPAEPPEPSRDESQPTLTLVSPPSAPPEEEAADSATSDLEPIADPEARWAALVENLHPTVGSILTHAVLVRWEGGVLETWLPESYLGFLTDEKKLAIEELSTQLSGGQVRFELRSGERPDSTHGPSIAEQREEDRRAAQENQRQQIKQSPLLAAAMEEFGVAPDQVSIDIQDEERH